MKRLPDRGHSSWSRESTAPSAENWKCSGGAGLPTPPSVSASLIAAHAAARGVAAQICSHGAQQSLDMVYSGKWGCSSLGSLRLLPRAWPAEHGSLYWCYWEKQLQSEYYFCRADRNPNSEIFLTQVFLTVLYITNIFIITHVQKILPCCKTSPEQIQEISTELQWGECINSGFLRAARLCVVSSGNPPKAVIKISMKLYLNN